MEGTMRKVAIIGTGFIGRAWAICFARAGFEARLWDANPAAVDNAVGYIEPILDDLAENDLLGGHSKHNVLHRLAPCASMAAALDGAGYVQESTPERIEDKIAVFRAITEAAAPDAIIASSTSALLPSTFTAECTGRERTIVVHPINPPFLIPACEVVPAPWTDERTLRETVDLIRSIGQVPIPMTREIDGFLMNRLQAALLNEAFRLVNEGYATATDVDAGIRDGLALRWSFMGPYETIDLNAPAGIRDYIERYGSTLARISSTMTGPVSLTEEKLAEVEAELRKRHAADELAERQRWRDRRLAALVAHKRAVSRTIGN
jgi:3-hydroxyacyl-CoA dehydrogenase